jgi:hypothetical protein
MIVVKCTSFRPLGAVWWPWWRSPQVIQSVIVPRCVRDEVSRCSSPSFLTISLPGTDGSLTVGVDIIRGQESNDDCRWALKMDEWCLKMEEFTWFTTNLWRTMMIKQRILAVLHNFQTSPHWIDMGLVDVSAKNDHKHNILDHHFGYCNYLGINGICALSGRRHLQDPGLTDVD